MSDDGQITPEESDRLSRMALAKWKWERLRDKAPELLAMLREVGTGNEGPTTKTCPVCGRFQSLGPGVGNHAPDCRLAALLAECGEP